MNEKLEQWESNARKRKYEQIRRGQLADSAYTEPAVEHYAKRTARFPALLAILNDLRSTGDVVGFQSALDRWSRDKTSGFGGFGQMYINQLVKLAPDQAELAALLSRALTLPRNEAEAAESIREVVAFTESIKKGGQPAPKRAPYALSYFWAAQDGSQWPCMWSSAESALNTHLGWMPSGLDWADYYLTYREIVLALGHPDEVTQALFWFNEHGENVLDPGLLDRLRHNRDLKQNSTAWGTPEEVQAAARVNARAAIEELEMFALDLEADVAETLRRSVRVKKPKVDLSPNQVRWDAWTDWELVDVGVDARVRMWATTEGLVVGLYPGWLRGEDWYPKSAAALEGNLPPGFQFFAIRSNNELESIGAKPHGGQYLVGRRFSEAEALDRVDFVDDVRDAITNLQPTLDRLIQAATGVATTRSQEEQDHKGLSELVQQFKQARDYPNEKDKWQRDERAAMARLLAPDELPTTDIIELRSIWNGGRYGNPGPQSVLNTTLRDADPDELESFLNSISYLLWEDMEPPSTRIDRCLDINDKGVKGLGESVIMKLLAIAHPDVFLPVYPYTGDMGKLRMLQHLDLEAPDPSLSRGERHVRANQAIRKVLDPFFPGDAWGQAQFLYWLSRQRQAAPVAVEDSDPLTQLAGEVLLDESFLRDVVALLREKRQVIFYGPPGTGKTFLAKKLAACLAPEPTRRATVQFHPSTSYEDFFEGYRPEQGLDGSLAYRLVPGPLALLSDRASNAPGIEHVMVIDEINRANLPKVLGELLFLFEYRSERVPTLYRAEEAFELPQDLLFIGTMNTADRSIALLDAALRRRFYFIPFFPDEGPMENLLDRWLEANNEPAEIGDIVRMVNSELATEFNGSDLLIGPSYFMRRGLTETVVRRIWDYAVHPYIADQLFGKPDRIRYYKFDRVVARFKSQSSIEPGEPIGTTDTEAE